ncbi:MAG: UDP-N-acetylmuramoyl-L-alanyl-D-glutamate--2,6-diaminopimelate ligase [Hyphomicrobiales bacterium]
MRLARLIAGLQPAAVTGLEGDGPEVASLHYRSQEVTPGGVFVAMRGQAADGHDFIDDALRRGAVAVVAEKPVGRGVAVIAVPSARQALAELAAVFYGRPSEHLTVIGVTGTNGKTTTTYVIESILAQAGIHAGIIGTINYRYGGKAYANPVTTPESLDLQRILADMLAAGVTHVVLEASSHAIDLSRVHCCWMDVGVFTNLSQDHLDYHGTMRAYWETKKRLFTEHLAAGPKAGRVAAVINTDSPHGRELAALLTSRVIPVGTGEGCTVRGANMTCSLQGIRGVLELGRARMDFASLLVGRHNVENILCAVGAATALDLPPEAIRSGIAALSCVPGRLERVATRSGRFVYVDYSHTPDALENALHALRELATGRLICVFGCGGDRDRTKRPIMGAIAARLSDLAVVTSDNPRTEDPRAIIEQILPGVREQGLMQVDADHLGSVSAGKAFAAEPDRRRAIETGIRAARPGDTVLIAGKGHEAYQVIGKQTIHFDDREEAARVLDQLEENAKLTNV